MPNPRPLRDPSRRLKRSETKKSPRNVRDLVLAETIETLSASDVGTWDWDVASDTVHCCAVTAAIFNVPDALGAEGIPLRRFEEAIHPDDRPRFQRLLEAACRDGGLFVAEYRTIPRPGQMCWVLARGSFDLDASGLPLRGKGIVIDITQSRLDEPRPERPYFINRPAENSPVIQLVADQLLATWEAAQLLNSDSLARLKTPLEKLLFEVGRMLAASLSDASEEQDHQGPSTSIH